MSVTNIPTGKGSLLKLVGVNVGVAVLSAAVAYGTQLLMQHLITKLSEKKKNQMGFIGK